MAKNFTAFNVTPFKNWLLTACVASLLSGCGGSDSSLSNNTQSTPQAQIATGITTLHLNDVGALPDAIGMLIAQPSFHVAPVQLDEPDDIDQSGHSSSALVAPQKHMISSRLSHLSTRRLTPQAQQLALRSESEQSLFSSSTATPMAAGSVVSTYTPAQIRAAYGLPPLPAVNTALSASQAAQLGAGQTIYIVVAYHNPNAAAELAAFNQKFGLPTCTTKTIATNATLPLASASKSGCDFAVVYSTPSGTMTSSVPAYNSSWAMEIALDVQWAHATAPLARIVLIESADASLNSLVGAVKLANAMGPGVVSMSFGANEGSWTASVDAAFTAPNMTYLAATGDSGAGVSWPSVSSNVVAVGGTTLSYSGSGPRSEVAWSGTGGGTSAYTTKPSYQNSNVPGLSGLVRRTVADVSFNADPASGQYVAVISPGSTAANWSSVGGTSLSTPQWAGVIAITNAVRALASKPALGAPHAILYGQIGATPTLYSSAFADVTQGTHGSCGACTAKAGYEQLTGLGTPNISNLIYAMSGVNAPVVSTPPVVTSTTINGKVGTALSFTASVTAPNPVTFSMTGAPSGMAISVDGAVTWPSPVAGNYAVTVTAKDTKTNLSGQGTYNIIIAQANPPVVKAGTINGQVGKALSFTPTITASNAVKYSLTGAPSGMNINSVGVVTWLFPVVGTYVVNITATDSITGLSGSGTSTVKISTSTVTSPAGLVITAPPINGIAGKPVSSTITISGQSVSYISVSISGVPMGMMFSSRGLILTATWASPVAGKYNMTVSAYDSAGRSAKINIPITITAK